MIRPMLMGAALLAAAPALAQQPPPDTMAQPAMAGAPAAVRALNGQPPEQMQLDTAQCQNAATQTTGYIPGTPPPAPTAKGPSGGRAKGAAKGAATGAVVGAVQNDQHPYAPPGMKDDHVGNQAAAGAAAGAVAGGMNQRQDRRKAAATDQKAAQADQQKATAFRTSFSTCLQSRGYALN